MFDLESIQKTLQEFRLDGWLLYDFRGSNVLARRVLGIGEEALGSRRYYYCIPADGEPRKLVHRIESEMLDHLPGSKTVYLRWQEMESGVRSLLDGLRTVAMEYSPRNANPYISRVDAGTVELVRSFGTELFPSGDLIQQFEATWTEEQWQLHRETARILEGGFERAWTFLAEQVRRNGGTDELSVREQLLDNFAEHGLETHHAPIVAVGPHGGNPHYETGTGTETAIRQGDFVLIDQWAKLKRPGAVYADFTHVGFVGEAVPEEHRKVFRIVARARDAAIQRVRDAFSQGRPLQGWEVDQAARDVIETAGYGEYFIHRTGHNIGQETHGNGAHMDNLETHEDRRVLPCTCFSIEPGIYLPDFGIRSEVNVFVDADGQVHVTGAAQTEVLPVLERF